MLCKQLFFLLYFFLLAIALSALLRFTDSDYPFVSSTSSRKVILHIQHLRSQKRKSLIIICLSCLFICGLSLKDDDCDLLLLYWIPKLVSIQTMIIAGVAKCSTQPLSNSIASIFTAIKAGFQKYHNTCFSRTGLNQMWLLKSAKDLLETLSSRPHFSNCCFFK